MIHSSSVEGHHFLTARRRGYDPAEVDAVIKRLVTTLRKYEEREERPEPAAELTAIVDLDQARVSRTEAMFDAAAATEHLQAEAESQLEESRRVAAAHIAEAEEEAAQLISKARTEANNLTSRRNTRGESLITAALSEVKALRARVLRETNEFRAGKKTEAAAMIQTAELEAAQHIEDARHEAGSILGRARREHASLEQRIGQLRSAIAGIEGQFRHLAESTLEQTEIVSSMISLETTDIEEVVEEAAAAEPEVVRLTQQNLTVDLTTTADTHRSNQPDSHFVVAPGNTIYQRRGGGLRKRLEDDAVEELE